MTTDATNADAALSDEISEPASPSITKEWTLILVRHGETEWNLVERIQGHKDIPLSDVGREQAHRLSYRFAAACREIVPRPLLPHFKTGPLVIDAQFSSDLCRVTETAHIVRSEVPHLSALPLTILPQLRERSFGEWEGLNAKELHARREGPHTEPPGGETEEQVYERMQTALDLIISRTQRSAVNTAVIYGHGGSLRALICRVLGLPADAMRSFRLENTCLSVLTIKGTVEEERLKIQIGRVISLNDTAHLLAADALSGRISPPSSPYDPLR